MEGKGTADRRVPAQASPSPPWERPMGDKLVLFELVAKTCAEKMDCRLNPYASTEYLDLVKYLCVLARTCRDANAWVLEFEGGWRFLAANAHHYRMRCRRSDKETGFNKYVSPNSKYVSFDRKKSTSARKS